MGNLLEGHYITIAPKMIPGSSEAGDHFYIIIESGFPTLLVR
jgi:hypothetical protein